MHVRRLGPGEGALLRALRLAALLDAPHAFASPHERERRDTADQWDERVARLAWFVAEDPAGHGVGIAAGTCRPDDPPARRGLIGMRVAGAVGAAPR